MPLLKFNAPHMHFSVAKMAGCLRGEQHVGETAENGHLSESISMIMKCVLGSPWEESSGDKAALHGEFCHRIKEVGGKALEVSNMKYTQRH